MWACTRCTISNTLICACPIEHHDILIYQENGHVHICSILSGDWTKDAGTNGEWTLDKASYAKGFAGLLWDAHSCWTRLQKAPLTGLVSKPCWTLPFVVMRRKSILNSGMETSIWIMELAKQVFPNLTKPTNSCRAAPSARATCFVPNALCCQKLLQCSMWSLLIQENMKLLTPDRSQ